MQELRNNWDQFNLNLNEVTDKLKLALSRWEGFVDTKLRIENWLIATEAILGKEFKTKGELSEMKTNLEKFKNLKIEIDSKSNDFDYLSSEADLLESEYQCTSQKDDLNRLTKTWQKLKSKCDQRLTTLKSEIDDHNSYYHSLQDTEKWLLQISFQLMAHNSLYISNRQQTLEQIKQHENLLDIIQKYQTNLDDLKVKGISQIDRYIGIKPSIKEIIETQLKNIQESYNSLLATSVQIRNRLQESLTKFQEYEDTLDSIAVNLEMYETTISELQEPANIVNTVKDQLKLCQNLHTKLQNEKSRLALAIQACEAATASISRPSSPLDTAAQPIPEKELMVRAKLEDLIDQVKITLI